MAQTPQAAGAVFCYITFGGAGGRPKYATINNKIDKNNDNNKLWDGIGVPKCTQKHSLTTTYAYLLSRYMFCGKILIWFNIDYIFGIYGPGIFRWGYILNLVEYFSHLGCK